MKIFPITVRNVLLLILFLSSFYKIEGQSNFYYGLNSASSLRSGQLSNHLFQPNKLNNNVLAKIAKADSISDYIPWESQKHFGTALGELGIVQLIPWTYARWITKWDDPSENWSKVGFKSWWRNLNLGWEYDEDKFLTNYFAHPYHGNLYFNSGRANGYDFGESAVWSFAGSAIWEFFAETERPSFNDWINTSVNGIVLGEITYKLATYVTDNTVNGSHRIWTEIAGALINPVRGFSRLISGEAYRVFPNPEWRIPKNFYLLFNGGFRQLDRDGDGDEIIKEGVQEGLFDFEVYYNNGFGKDLDVPFSSINFSASIVSGSPNLTQLSANGNLYGWLLNKKSNRSHILNITLQYNYFNNPRFIYGGTSVIPHLISSFKIKNNLYINTTLGLNVVLMGATPNDYYTNGEGRDYDFGPGIGNYLAAVLKNGIWDLIRVYYQGQWIWTQSEPGDSRHHLHTLWIDAQYPLTSYFAIGFGSGVFWRESYYDNFNDITIDVPIVKVFFKTAIF